MIERVYGEAFTFHRPLIKAGSTAFAVNADWTYAAGDVKISKDGGTPVNLTTTPTYVANIGWLWSVTATEAEAAEININVHDAAGAEIDDNHFVIKTIRHPLAADPRGVLARGLAQSGSSTGVTLAAGSFAANDIPNGFYALIVAGTGAKQARQILDFTASSQFALTYVAAAGGAPAQGSPWAIEPDNTSKIEVYPFPVTPIPINAPGGVVAVNVTQIAGQTANAAGAVTFPATIASTTNITAGTITTVTNLTNAPTAGDLTPAMKASVTLAADDATPNAASVTGAVGSVTAGVTLADGAHGGAAAVLTLKRVVIANTVNGETAVNISASGTGNAHAVNILASGAGKGIAVGAAGVALSIDSSTTEAITLNGLKIGEAVADGFVLRNIAGGSSTGRLIGEAFAAMRNRVELSDITANSATMSVYAADDTTVLWTAVVALAARNPMTGANPA